MTKHVPLEGEEFAALHAEMTALLEKYNCDMQVTSQIVILKRVEDEQGKETTQTD